MKNLQYENRYINTIIISKEIGWREIYSSQNYGTFYAVYLNFEMEVNENDDDLITLKNIQFKITNYKGLLNLGIKNATLNKHDEEDALIIRLELQAMNPTRNFPIAKSFEFKKSNVLGLEVMRELIPMLGFQGDINPNDERILVFDEEYYYRDSTKKPDSRVPRSGRSSINGTPSIPTEPHFDKFYPEQYLEAMKNGVRCHHQKFSVVYV